MFPIIRKIGLMAAVISFVLCLGAGLWILTKTGLTRGNDVVSVGLGLYFVGKAFFVGPMLLLASTARDAKD
jgi:hypothetical protein